MRGVVCAALCWLVPACVVMAQDSETDQPAASLGAYVESLAAFESEVRDSEAALLGVVDALVIFETGVKPYPYAYFVGMFEQIGGESIDDTLVENDPELLPEEGSTELVKLRERVASLGATDEHRTVPAQSGEARFCKLNSGARAPSPETLKTSRRMNATASQASLKELAVLHDTAFEMQIQRIATTAAWRMVFLDKARPLIGNSSKPVPGYVSNANQVLAEFFEVEPDNAARAWAQSLLEQVDEKDQQLLDRLINDLNNNLQENRVSRNTEIDLVVLAAHPPLSRLLDARIEAREAAVKLTEALAGFDDKDEATPTQQAGRNARGTSCTHQLDGTFGLVLEEQAQTGGVNIDPCSDHLFFLHRQQVEVATGVMAKTAPLVIETTDEPPSSGKNRVRTALVQASSNRECDRRLYISFKASVTPTEVEIRLDATDPQVDPEPLRYAVEVKNFWSIRLRRLGQNGDRHVSKRLFAKDSRWLCHLVLPPVPENAPDPPAIATLRDEVRAAKEAGYC